MHIINKIKQFLALRRMPIDDKLINWLISHYDNVQKCIGSNDTSSYYVVQLQNNQPFKIRISNHLQVFNNCKIFVQTIENDSKHVLICMNCKRQFKIATFKQATEIISNAIDNANNGKQDIIVDVNNINALPENHIFADTNNVISHWPEFKRWYGNILGVDFDFVDGKYVTMLNLIVIKKQCRFNKFHEKMVCCLKSTNGSLYEALDMILKELAIAKSVNTPNVVNNDLHKVRSVCSNIASTLNQKQLYKLQKFYNIDFTEKQFDDFMKIFGYQIGNIGYETLSEQKKKDFAHMFNNQYLDMKRTYEVFAHMYNKYRDLEIAIGKTNAAIEHFVVKHLQKNKELNGTIIAKYYDSNESFKNSKFFNSCVEYDCNFDSCRFRGNNQKETRVVLAKMFPWVSTLYSTEFIRLHKLCLVDVPLKRIVESLLIAHDTCSDSDAITVMNVAHDVLTKQAWSNTYWDFESNSKKAIPVAVQIVHKQTLSNESWLDDYAKRKDNKEKLDKCLCIDIRYFDRYTPKQKEIVEELLSHCIPYEQCVNAINNNFWTTKSLKKGCEKLKKAFS